MDLPVTLVVAAATILMVVGLAAAAQRLLGVRFGTVRTLLAALLAFALAQPLTEPILGAFGPQDMRDDVGIGPLWVLILVVMCVVLIPMVILVLAEALVPPGSIPGPLELVRSLRGRISRARRYSQITRIAVRHGLGPYLRGRGDRPEGRTGAVRLARSLRLALDDGGVTFVKLGQVLSTRRDLLPPEFTEELRRLQDQVAAEPWERIEPVLRAELGGPVEEVFAAFDRTPLAAASIAQAYTARLRGGEEVVVKVQRPGIGRTVARDLDIVRRLAVTLETRTRWGRTIGVRDLAEGFAAAITEELDFRVEAANMAAVAASATPGVTYPTPVPALCTERVLVMQRLSGRPVTAATPAQGHALARDLLGCLLRQILIDGVFHADPHPGNLMLLDDGTLGLLDFGSVGRLDASVRAALQRFLLAMNRQDPLGVTDALLEVVPRPEDIDEPALERALGQFMAKHLGPGLDSVQLFTEQDRLLVRALDPARGGRRVPGAGDPGGHARTAVARIQPDRRGPRLRPPPPRRPARRRERARGRHAGAGRAAAHAAPPAAPCRTHRQRRRARTARAQRAAAGRRARPQVRHRAGPPGAAHRARRHRRADGRHPPRHRGRPRRQRPAEHDPVPAHRLQPAGDQRHPGAARARPDLPAAVETRAS